MLALPVVFVCENNLYGEFTPMAAVTAGGDIARPRGAPTACRPRRSTATTCGRCAPRRERAVARARARRRARRSSSATPTATYGHSKTDPGAYRPEGSWRTGWPATRSTIAAARLVEAGVAEPSESPPCDAAVRADVEAGVEAALAAPYPDPAVAAREYAR